MNFTRIQTFPDLVEYLRDYLDWPFYEEDAEDNRFDYNLEELGIDPKYEVAIERISQLRPSEDNGNHWGIFYLEFEKKQLPVVVLRRILRALVPKARANAKSASLPSWNAGDLLFICTTGDDGHRGVSFAHFREVEKHHVAQLRTFGWDETETHLFPLAQKLEKLRWENQNVWGNAFTLRHGQLVGDSKALASELAVFARGIRLRALELYGVEAQDGQLHKLHEAFQSALIADMDEKSFADTIAQTIAYGLFAGRATGAQLGKIGLADLEVMVPKTNPFLRELFGQFTRLGFDIGKGVDFDDLGIVDLVEFLNGVPVEEIVANFGRQAGGGNEDPVVYFYENFLKEYDEEQRVQRGVYYTPKPVVDFIVRGVHQLLIDELDCPDGLADVSTHIVDGREQFKVMILDPATGTGTFLQSAIETIHAHLQAKWKAEGTRSDAALRAKWNEYVPKFLLPRLHGFELMMASYTVAHMKLGLKLQELGYEFGSDERLRVYLTNTLEPPHEGDQKTLDFPDFLAHEALAADAVKGQTPISVVIGNPPYSGISTNNGDWINGLLHGNLPHGGKSGSYYEIDGQPLGERRLWLQDDYVKFIRYSQGRLEARQKAILGFITNHGYFDNPTFRGMRQSLMQTFGHIAVYDLHGNALKSEVNPEGGEDKNVFDIQQGVGIGLFVRDSEREEQIVERADVWGRREKKYDDFRQSKVQMPQRLTPNSPFYFFRSQDDAFRAEYESGWNLNKALADNIAGIVTARDFFVSDLNEKSLLNRIADFRSDKSDEEIRNQYFANKGSSKYDSGDSRGWKLPEARKRVKEDANWEKRVVNCLYRPFDVRPLYYVPWMVDWPRPESMKHMIVGDESNIAISTSRNVEIGRGFEHVFASRHIIQHHTVSIKEVNYLFPLYLYPSKTQLALDTDAQLLGFGEGKRRANLAPAFVAQLGTQLGLKWQSDGRGDGVAAFGPEDVLAYIYAIFHAPSYRARYAEFLKTDFPRVPLSDDAALFWSLVEAGHQLLAIHTLSAPAPASATAGATPLGEVAAGFPKLQNGRVMINKSSSFDDVPVEVWEFHIGGYQVAHKWLKDRKGRVLSDADAAHYRTIIWSLGQTLSLMETIDAHLENAGGFPLSGSQEPIEADVNAFFG